MADNNITDRIAKLLAMAEHPNSNQNEAAVALEKAQEMLLKHNLVREDIINNEVGTPAGIGQLTITEDTGYSWKRSLASVIAKANLCRVIGAPSANTWHIFGSYDNVRSVIEMYNWITLQLSFMCNRDFRAYKNDEGTERGQTWKLGYYQGAIGAIKDRLDKPMQAFSYGTGHDLVIRNEASLTEAVHKIFPRLRTSYGYASRSTDGRSSGASAGRGMSLSPARRLTGALLLR
tara:strand:+ start:95 stop:793 length:699 start_codon:yes stop_codon:yes gene_type:complete